MAGRLVPECTNVRYVAAFLAAPLVRILLINISSVAPYGRLPARLSRLVTPFSKRLCLVSPSPDNAQLLALVSSLYHSAPNMFKGDDVSPMPRAVQRNLVEAARAFRPHIL